MLCSGKYVYFNLTIILTLAVAVVAVYKCFQATVL